ncbi:hypothetical protein [Rosistilla carotiformis]|nr:hypothetical protein [Rosistilla carotiformis]
MDRRSSFPFELGYLMLASLPLIGVIAILGGDHLRQRSAAAALQQRTEDALRAGIPIDNDSMSEVFARTTSNANTAAWQELQSAAIAIQNDRPLRDEPSESTPEISPEEIERMQRAAPVIEAIDRLTRDPRPIWQSIVFNGFQTPLESLQDSRILSQLLHDEFRVAMAQQEPQRALDALRLTQAVALSLREEFCIVTDLVNIAHRKQHQAMVHESLAAGFWTAPESLDAIANQVAWDDDPQQRWEDALRGERAFVMQALNTQNEDSVDMQLTPTLKAFPFGIAPTQRQACRTLYNRLIALTGAGTAAHSSSAQAVWTTALMGSNRGVAWSAIPFANTGPVLKTFSPAAHQFANALAREQQERHWTLFGVAIKRFQLQKGRWPLGLDELSGLEMLKSAGIDFNSEPMGYEVAADGDVAYLWITPPDSIEHSKTRPVESDQQPGVIKNYTLEVR